MLALVALGYGGLPPLPRAFATMLVGFYGYLELRRAGPRAPRYVSRIVVTGDGCFQLGFAREPGNLVPVTVVSFWRLPAIAVGLAFAGGPTQHAQVILFRDRLPPDTWRHLAVRLRHASGAGS